MCIPGHHIRVSCVYFGFLFPFGQFFWFLGKLTTGRPWPTSWPTPGFVPTHFIIRSLNARIDSRENWTPTQRLDGVFRLAAFARLPASSPAYLTLASLVFSFACVEKHRGCEQSGKNHLFPVQVAKSLVDLGCYEVSLGDTIGVGAPG